MDEFEEQNESGLVGYLNQMIKRDEPVRLFASMDDLLDNEEEDADGQADEE
jgi:hypothetical protein